MKVIDKGYPMNFEEVPTGGVFKYKDKTFIKMSAIPSDIYQKIAFMMAGNALELETGKRVFFERFESVYYFLNATIAV